MKKIAVRINGAWIPLLVFMDVSLILLFLLSPVVNFANILRATFTRTDYKKGRLYFFMLLESALIKSACK